MAFVDIAKKYYMTFILVTIFVLIYILNFINSAISMFNSGENVPFPPWISPCPDYWSNVSTNGKVLCSRTQPNGPISYQPKGNVSETLGYDFSIKNPNPVDFSSSTLKEKCEWSKDSGVYWEGISDKVCSSFT